MSKKSKEIRAPKFKPGDMVFMHSDPSEFDPGMAPSDEIGRCEGAEGWDYDKHCPKDPEQWFNGNIMYIVVVPKGSRTDPDDFDGMREIHEDELSYYRPTGQKRS